MLRTEVGGVVGLQKKTKSQDATTTYIHKPPPSSNSLLLLRSSIAKSDLPQIAILVDQSDPEGLCAQLGTTSATHVIKPLKPHLLSPNSRSPLWKEVRSPPGLDPASP